MSTAIAETNTIEHVEPPAEPKPAKRATSPKPNDHVWIKQVKAAQVAGVPILAVNTPDPAATMKAVESAIGGEKIPVLEWDYVRGVNGRNDIGSAARVEMVDDPDPTVCNWLEVMVRASKLKARSILFIHLAHRWLPEAAFVQALWNLRDQFKKNGRILVLLGKGIALPAELTDDVVMIEEPLPGTDEIGATVKRVFASALKGGLVKAECTDAVVSQSVEALRGVSAFAAEQATAMSLTKRGISVDELWEHKRKMVEATPGLTVWRGDDSFDRLGGLTQVKSYLTDLMNGPEKPSAVIWLDEIEKAMAGSENDTSGVSQDQLGSLLTEMEDCNIMGVLFVGAPGTGKSAAAKAAGSAAGAPTVRLDLGACKGSLVGQSEQTIRQALKVIRAISNNRPLFIATANSVANLDSALKRRFPLQFYFDLPDREEKAVIWDVWTSQYDLPSQERPEDTGWSGANIQKCCECAWRLRRTLIEASKFIIPASRSAARELASLRRQAVGTFLSASREGAYQLPKEDDAGGRSFETRE